MSGSLFEENEKPSGPPPDAPLADRMRPQSLDEIVGQRHLLDPGKPLRTAIERDQVPSMILWGPPGVGKTTLARIIARMTRLVSEELPAISLYYDLGTVVHAGGLKGPRAFSTDTTGSVSWNIYEWEWT